MTYGSFWRIRFTSLHLSFRNAGDDLCLDGSGGDSQFSSHLQIHSRTTTLSLEPITLDPLNGSLKTARVRRNGGGQSFIWIHGKRTSFGYLLCIPVINHLQSFDVVVRVFFGMYHPTSVWYLHVTLLVSPTVVKDVRDIWLG
jgi:hypothetical protein